MFKNLSPKSKIESLMLKYSKLIRERAIAQAKAKIAQNGKFVEDLTEKQLEIIVAEEEFQIKSKIRKSTFIGILAFFGIATF